MNEPCTMLDVMELCKLLDENEWAFLVNSYNITPSSVEANLKITINVSISSSEEPRILENGEEGL